MTIRWQEPQVCTGEAMSPAGGHLLAWEHLQFSSLTKEGSLAGRSGYLQSEGCRHQERGLENRVCLPSF